MISGPVARPARIVRAVAIAVALMVVAVGCTGRATPVEDHRTAVQKWLAGRPMYVAHRGGDADWTQGTADAYARAAAWNPQLALEVPVWRTSDGIWVVSEAATTGAVFGTDYRIDVTPWSVLATLRTRQGHFPMARLLEDVLQPYGGRRVLFVDNKSNAHAGELLGLLDGHGGPGWTIIKAYWSSVETVTAARQRGYTTWGYYAVTDMPSFAGSQHDFDLLAMDYSAPQSVFRTLLATGKPVFAYLIATQAEAKVGRSKGATGLMVSGIQEVVPHRQAAVSPQ